MYRLFISEVMCTTVFYIAALYSQFYEKNYFLKAHIKVVFVLSTSTRLQTVVDKCSYIWYMIKLMAIYWSYEENIFLGPKTVFVDGSFLYNSLWDIVWLPRTKTDSFLDSIPIQLLFEVFWHYCCIIKSSCCSNRRFLSLFLISEMNNSTWRS